MKSVLFAVLVLAFAATADATQYRTLGLGLQHNVAARNTTPFGVHIAYASPFPDLGMTFSYLTINASDASCVGLAVDDGAPLTVVCNGTAASYYSTWTHHVEVGGLKPSTKYRYRVGSQASGWSPEFSFTSDPAPSDAAQRPWSVAVVGDMGVLHSANTSKLLTKMARDPDGARFVIHVGDFGYADDRLSPTLDFEATWNQWQSEVEETAAFVPYMTLPGNHEATCRSIGPFFCGATGKALSNFTAYNARFRMPSRYSGGSADSSMFYSFDSGNAHFVMLSTETDYPYAPEGVDSWYKCGPFGDQLAWLEEDLKRANANREERPWLIVAGHRPTFSSKAKDQVFPPGIVDYVRKIFQGLLVKYNVDVYLAGHVHAYERMYPCFANETVAQHSYVDPPKPVSVVCGAAGNIEGHEHTSGWAKDYPCLAYRNFRQFGLGSLTFHNSTHLTWNFYTADDEHLDDTFTLVRTRD